MENIKSILKASIEQLGLVEHLTVEYILVSLACAALCGLAIYFVYKIFYRGAVYSENFAVLLVLVTLVTAFVVLTIGSNLVLSLGMVGALSIVRFRSAVKDPLDVGFMFWGLAAGITSGAGLYPFAVIATLVIAVVYILFTVVGRGKTTYVLVVKHTDEALEAVNKALDGYKTKLRGRAKYKGENELTVDIKVKKGNTEFMDKLLATEGVVNAVLVEYTGE